MNNIQCMDLVGLLGLNDDGYWPARMGPALEPLGESEEAEEEEIDAAIVAVSGMLDDWLGAVAKNSSYEDEALAELLATIAFVAIRRRNLAEARNDVAHLAD